MIYLILAERIYRAIYISISIFVTHTAARREREESLERHFTRQTPTGDTPRNRRAKEHAVETRHTHPSGLKIVFFKNKQSCMLRWNRVESGLTLRSSMTWLHARAHHH